jgi:hypothetical protein
MPSRAGLALAAEDLLFARQRQVEVLAPQRGALQRGLRRGSRRCAAPLLEDRA